MNEKWEYGGSYVSYPIKPAVPYTIDENIIMVHDLTEELPDFMKKADILFIDPPWNLRNLNTFYMKARLMPKVQSYEEFYEILFKRIGEIEAKLCFLEIGKEYLADFIKEMKKLYKHVTFYNSTYYNNDKNFCYIVQGSEKRLNLKLDGMDEEKIIEFICKNIQYECIGDMCMGRGLVGFNSYLNNKNFVGIELNHKRLSVLLKNISKLKYS
ncbi:16S rRNA G966 N2-methylase RsmD [Fusobacterium sp. PH5-7]|uniref:hypothetical protein n=1 Tax=Fusobacterium sp. PH5-7 TaxID=2940528 RepID=UPI002475786D|nr:hypothetical protein [Fusobacterium sp. PH5-7]MDH6458038.1 16S rRNA G966 N2-methylase RsmD [Fusobacterium sp. PH5-7]